MCSAVSTSIREATEQPTCHLRRQVGLSLYRRWIVLPLIVVSLGAVATCKTEPNLPYGGYQHF
jgi:hypothetical protein